MMKAMFMGAAALMLSAGAAAAGEWERIIGSDGAAMAVDWESLRINGTTRGINMAAVVKNPEQGQFHWATSMIEIDCAPSRSRYQTKRSSFFNIDGSSADVDFVGDGSWTDINTSAMMADIRREVCAASTGKQGNFDDPLSFAVNMRRVWQGGG